MYNETLFPYRESGVKHICIAKRNTKEERRTLKLTIKKGRHYSRLD